MSFFRKYVFHSPGHYIAAALAGIAISLIMLFNRGFDKAFYYYDALSTAGLVCIFFGLLKMVAYFGAFDIFTYSFRKLSRNNRRRSNSGYDPMQADDPERKRFESLFEYSNQEKEKRRRSELTFIPYILVGIVFLIAGIIVKSVFFI